MASRKRRGGIADQFEGLIEEGLRGAADGIFDVARQAVTDIGMNGVKRAMGNASATAGRLSCAHCQAATSVVCASCQRPFCASHIEFMAAHRPGVCLCSNCVSFMWGAAEEKIRAQRQAQQRKQAEASREEANRPTRADWRALELSPTASAEAIQAAWKRLARMCHPDRFPEGPKRDAAEERFKRLTQARDRCLAFANGKAA